MQGFDFVGRHDRADQIWEVKAHTQTVDWIWSSTFAAWVSSSDALFWMCGKPASGKSTMMESIAKSDSLQKHLRKSVDDQWIVIYHFFFDFGVDKDLWNNFEGFLRSMLYQLTEKLKYVPDIARSESSRPWSKRELEERLDRVFKETCRPLCLLLDGLDEHQDDQWDLVNFLKDIAKPRTKVCVASRPTSIFKIGFEAVPQIRMQDYNKPAIEYMVKDTIRNSVGRADFYVDHEVDELAERISEEADGVFPWARFAVKELRDGLSTCVDLSKLQSRLKNVPKDLEDIFARILKSLQPDQRQDAARLLQLVCHARRLLTVQELAFALS